MSSNSPLVRVEGLGKKYRIKGSQLIHQRNLSEELVDWTRKPFQSSAKEEEFWALENIHATLHPGDSVGIIGPNGSGKSTLLKILSRVIWPTVGRVEIQGRVGALLEVGTGFHVELSGRENIYLSGAMLGMKRSEVTRHFDAIVAFSEVEKFLELPVKQYSSGMFLRLAFSVMAHLKSDILILDEVLAVGDAAFQEKCIQKMQSVASEGRIVIFVSHHMEKIRLLCNRILWIKNGHLMKDCSVQEMDFLNEVK